MRFRAREQQRNTMPEVNLVPMMDVIMTILTFFIILSMTMSNFQSVDVRLPGKGDSKSTSQTTPTEPLVVGVTLQGQIVLQGQTVDQSQLLAQVQGYLGKNPQGVVILNADKAVPYEKVVQLLGTLRDVGGDRVSLAIQ
jgi:biopolymer transport protein ExbD